MPTNEEMRDRRVEIRWSTNPCSPYFRSGIWCLIDDGRAYPYTQEPFEIDEWIAFLEGKTMQSVSAWADDALARRSPPGTDEEEWLRLNDTRHPEYTGP